MVLSWCPLKGANGTNLLLFDLSVDFIRNILLAQYIYIYRIILHLHIKKPILEQKMCRKCTMMAKCTHSPPFIQ